MKKVVIYFLMLILVINCTACNNKQNEAESIDAKTITQEEFKENTTKIITNDFNDETNKTITLQKLKLEIPEKWEYITDEVEALHFSPDKEVPPFFSFVIMPFEENKVFDFTKPLEQNSAAHSITKAYISNWVSCNVNNYGMVAKSFTLSNGDKIDILDKTILNIDCSGNVYNIKYTGKILAFYIDDDLCVFNLFQALESKYDFTGDLISIINSVEKVESMELSGEQESDKEVMQSQDVSKIKVTYAKDSFNESTMNLKVYVKNTSDSKFSGNIHIYFYSADRKIKLGSDTIIVKDLMPGQQSWSNVTVDKYLGSPLMEKEFTNVKFVKIESSSAALDDYKTEKTKNSVRLNFDIANWYKYIKSIKVYTDGTCEVIVTPSSDDTVIASSVWSCGHEYGVKSVRVADNSGNTLAVFSR